MMAVYHDGQDVQVTPVVGFAAYRQEASGAVRIDAIIQDPASPGTFVDTEYLKSYAGFGGLVPTSAIPAEVIKRYRETTWSDAVQDTMKKVEGTHHPSLSPVEFLEDHPTKVTLRKLRKELSGRGSSDEARRLLDELEATLGNLYAEVFHASGV
jgi:hypothetical protein